MERKAISRISKLHLGGEMEDLGEDEIGDVIEAIKSE